MKSNISGDIATHRKLMGLTQEELADQLMINRKTVGEWEKGESAPNKTSRRKLSNLFGVEFTAKGIKETHIDMKIEKENKQGSSNEEDWYKKTIDSLIEQHESIIDKYTVRTDKQINSLENDKTQLWELVRGQIKPAQ